MINENQEKFLKQVGNQVRSLRKSKGLSMQALAYKAEIEYRQLGRLERGEGNITIITIHKIAVALEIEVMTLFYFD